MLRYRRWKCIRRSSTTVTTSSEPSLSCGSNLPVTTATPQRSFSTLKRLKTYLRSSMVDERLTSLALIHVHAQTTPIEPVEVVDRFALTHWLEHTILISCARLSCFCPSVYIFILKFSLVMSCEFSIMSLASGGFASRPPPGLCPWTLLGDFRPPDPLFRIPCMKILDPPLHYCLWCNEDPICLITNCVRAHTFRLDATFCNAISVLTPIIKGHNTWHPTIFISAKSDKHDLQNFTTNKANKFNS